MHIILTARERNKVDYVRTYRKLTREGVAHQFELAFDLKAQRSTTVACLCGMAGLWGYSTSS